MPNLLHTMLDSDGEVQDQVETVFGFCACLWQIRVVRAILNGDDVITIAPSIETLWSSSIASTESCHRA
jgi:hypothetical protein